MSFQDRLRADTLKFLYDYWRELYRGRSLPSRADVDPLAIVSVLPHIGLFDVERSPRRYRIRLMGARIVNWYGCDVSGRYLDEIDFGVAGESTYGILDQAVDRALPAHMSGEYTKQDGRKIRYERLFLPLANVSQRVDMLIGAACLLSDGAQILGDCLDT